MRKALQRKTTWKDLFFFRFATNCQSDRNNYYWTETCGFPIRKSLLFFNIYYTYKTMCVCTYIYNTYVPTYSYKYKIFDFWWTHRFVFECIKYEIIWFLFLNYTAYGGLSHFSVWNGYIFYLLYVHMYVEL